MVQRIVQKLCKRMPISWDVIRSTISKNGVFYRSVQTQKAYAEYISDIYESGDTTPSDEISMIMFPTSNEIEEPFCLTINKFPYHTESSIHNYIAWVNPRVTFSDETYEEMFGTIRSNLDTFVLFHRNPVEARSIKGVEHYHVFSTTPPGLIDPEFLKKH
jgi:hypothetical protein